MDNIHQLFSADATFYVLTCFDNKNILSILGYFTQNGRIFPPNGPKLNFIVDLSLYYLSRDSTQGTILPASDQKNTQSLHVRNHKIHFLPPHDL